MNAVAIGPLAFDAERRLGEISREALIQQIERLTDREGKLQ